MNNIYKVIWSKAKNCYVVASEIARSHTKSATGSEKIGGVTRRSLLASLMALSLLCGGLGVAEAAVVHVNEVDGGTSAVYTTDETYTQKEADLKYATKMELTAKGEAIATNTANIATNQGNIKKLEDDKLSKDVASATSATNKALNDLENAVTNKVDESVVEEALNGKANTDLSNLTEAGKSAIKNTMSADMDSKANKVDVYSRTDADDKFATKDALNGKADQTALNQATDRITANEAAITGLTTKTTDQQTAIDDLKKKTAEISHEAGSGTNISGVTIKDGNIVGNNNSSISGLTNVETRSINGKSLTGTNVATEKEVKDVADAVKKETDARTEADKALDEKITKNSQDIARLNENGVKYDTDVKDKITLTGVDGTTITRLKDAALNDSSTEAVTGKQLYKTNAELAAETKARTDKDTELEKRIATNSGDITALDGKIKTNADNIQTNKNDINTIKQRTAGIDRIDATKETTIEGHVTVDDLGNVTADGAVKAGSLNVSGESDLKGNVTLGTSNGTNKVTVNGKADFHEVVNMDKGLTVNGKSDFKETVEMDNGLTVTSGATSLKETTVNGALTAKENATFEKNVTVQNDLTVNGKLNVDKISLKNDELKNGKKHDSATTITADEISNLAKVTEQGNTTESQFTHNEKGTFNYAKDEKSTGEWKRATSNVTADGVSNKMTDSDGNRHTYSQTATESKERLVNGNKSNFEKKTAKENIISIKDKDADKSLTNKQTVDGEKTSVTNKESSSTIKQEADQIRYNVTSKDENKTSSSIEVKADGITNTSKDGTITNDAKDIVNNATGNMTNTVGGNQKNKIDGNQENTIGGNQTTTVTGDISNTAKNITNEANTKLTDKVGTNTRVLDSEGITDTVPGADGKGSTFKQRIDAIMGNVKTDAGESEVTQKGDEITSVVGKGEATNSRVTQKKGSLEAAVTDGTNTNVSYDVANASAKVLTDGTKENKLQDNLYSSEKTITNGTYKTSKLQTALDITNTAKNGTITNDAKNIVNNATGDMTNTVGGKLTTTVTGQATENFKGGLKTDITGEEIHTVTGNQTNKVTGKQTNTVEGGQENIISGGQINNITGDQTTIISGTQTTTATDINRNASSGMIDTIDNAYGTNTETKVAGKTTTDVSIKGTGEKGQYIRGANESRDYLIKGTLMNSETKTAEATSTEITDGNGKTSATIQDKTQISGSVTNGTSSAVSNVKADSIDMAVIEGTNTSLISQKKDSITSAVGNGTTSTVIQQGVKDITIASNGGTVGIVGKDIINNATDEITNTAGTKITDQVGSNTRVIDQTSITDTVGTANRKIEDGKITDTAGDFTVTTDKANGTTFTNAGSTASSFTTVDGTDTGSAQRWTNVKGNEISTGKVEANYVKMDYADVMKDLGVHGNAKIAGKTTTGSLEVTGTSTLKGDVTMENNAIVKKNLTVEGITTTKTLKVTENAEVGGTLKVAKKATFEDSVSIAKDLSVGGDVTANSYKVGDKTYIDADGIHANNQKITDVADGSISEGSKDAVNGGQLYGVKRDLEHQVDKVGANAAAMANLRPMEFDPSSKWNIAAAIGNYGSETAAALGAFYRPNDNVMVNLSTAFGTGENMVGGGVSVRLGKGGNKLSREETNALKAQVADLTARMDALLSVLNPNMSKDFPDVPENHWAYEAVSRLAGNDIVQGYPDGEFHGERTMTRYEMAEIIYNALSRGAEAEKELVEEFKPELQAMAASEKATAEKAEG